MAVFIFLCIELVITLILVLPLPRIVRRLIARGILKLNLGPRVRFVSQFILFGLAFAFVDSIQTLNRLTARESEPSIAASLDPRQAGMDRSMERQRKFRAERNIYLSAFALTLLFVIARIVELLQENTKFEDERDGERKKLDDVAGVRAQAGQTSAAGAEGGGLAAGLRNRLGGKKD